MPLSDYFGKDPYVQAGVFSRGDNWRMRLGSLAAALGHMDRPGMLGQALAQAGAIYQDQRRGALSDALDRMKEEDKQRREDELYRMRIQQEEDRQYDRDAAIEEKKRVVQEKFDSRKAMQWGLHQHGLDPSLADNPTLAQDEINEAQEREREAAKAKTPERPFQFGSEGGSLVTMNPDGSIKQHRILGQPDTLTPQEKYLKNLGYDPADPAVKDRYLKDQGLLKESGDALTAKGKIELVNKMATDLVEQSADEITGKPTLGYDAALKEAKRRLTGLLEEFDTTKAPKPMQGRDVAGNTIPKPGLSSPGNARTKIVRAGGAKLDESDSAALLKIQNALSSIPDQKQRTKLMAMAMQENASGKSWAMLWNEMNAP